MAPVSRRMRVSRRSDVPAFEVMAILDRIAALRAAGRHVVSLCAGEPSGGAPTDVRERAARLPGDHDLGYTPPLGLHELRAAIAGHYRRWYGVDVDPASVAVTTGASGAFVLLFLAAFDAGDRVAVTRPGYPAYRNLLRTLGVDVVEVPVGPGTGFQPTVDALEAAARSGRGGLDGLVLASPANPTGSMVDRPQLTALAEWCAGHDVRLISDEIYHGITYPSDPAAPDARGCTAVSLGVPAVVVSSFSKYWGMTGWRLGWALVPDDLRAAVDALAGNVALCPPTPAQMAALGAFTERSYAEADARVADLARTRALVLGSLDRLAWGPVAPAAGAFYLWAGIGEQLAAAGAARRHADSVAWCRALLEEAGVAVVPGTDMDAVDGGTFVRLSFAAGHAAVAEAIERIVAFQSGA